MPLGGKDPGTYCSDISKGVLYEIFSWNCRLEKEYQIFQKFLEDEHSLNEYKEFELASQALDYAKQVMSQKF